MALAKGEDVSSRPLAEGVPTTAMALKIARNHKIEAPIIETMNSVLIGDLTPKDAVLALLSRPLKLETPAR